MVVAMSKYIWDSPLHQQNEQYFQKTDFITSNIIAHLLSKKLIFQQEKKDL